MLLQAQLDESEAGLVPVRPGWFVHRAGAEEETSDPAVTCARLPNKEPMPYRDGLLPGS